MLNVVVIPSNSKEHGGQSADYVHNGEQWYSEHSEYSNTIKESFPYIWREDNSIV